MSASGLAAGGTRRRFIAAMALLSAVTVLPRPASAYEREVHMDATTRIADMWGLDLGPRERRWVGFCAELPDEADELSAVSLYGDVFKSPYRWFSWGLGSSTSHVTTQRMIKVQQLLHGLTGGSIDELAAARDETLEALVARVPGSTSPRDRLERLCALGFGIHLLGDSYAHRNLSEPTRMYPTGQGHARHGVQPDRILRLGRPSDVALLGAYTEDLAKLGATPFTPPWTRIPWLDRSKTIEDLERSLSERDANDKARRLARHDGWADLDVDRLSPGAHDVESCQGYLDKLFVHQTAIERLLPRPASSGSTPAERFPVPPRCHCIWRSYAEVTAPIFLARSVGDPDFGDLGSFADPFPAGAGCE